jgi:hypothetical protein
MDNGDDRQFPGGQTCATAGITPCPYSTVGIYDIDEVAKTATIAFHTTIPDFASFGGNTTVLANGNLEFDLCALTATPGHSIVREVDPRVGTQTVWELNVARFAYRAFRLPSLYPGVQW